jgi:WD40 repeat protein
VPGWDGDDESLQDWTPQGDRLAFVDRQHRLRVVYASSGSVLATRRLPGLSSVEYDGQGDTLLADVEEGVVLLDAWTLEPVTEPASLDGRRNELVVLGPGDDTVVLLTTKELGGDYDAFGAARRWTLVDLETGETLRQGRLRYSAQSAALSPDGRRLAVGSADGLELVDLRTGRTRSAADLGAGHETEGRHVTWSGDGTLVTTGDSSGRVSLWDGRTSALLGTIRPGATYTSSVFLEDDRTLLIAAWDGAVYEWDTSVDHAVETACRIVGSGLDEARWRAAFGSRPYKQAC